jgi:hypothetical protein
MNKSLRDMPDWTQGFVGGQRLAFAQVIDMINAGMNAEKIKVIIEKLSKELPQ